MTTELFKLTLAFRGLSDEDEEDSGVEDPGTLDDEDDEDDDDDAEVSVAADDDDADSTLEG